MRRRTKLVLSLIVAGFLAVSFVLLQEADARHVWRRCNQGGFPYSDTEDELNATSRLNHVRCDSGRCEWHTWLRRWSCELRNEAGTARQGGSG